MWRMLLWLYPPEFRKDHGAEVESFVTDERAKLTRAGQRPGPGFEARIAWDMTLGALRLWLARSPHRDAGGRGVTAFRAILSGAVLAGIGAG